MKKKKMTKLLYDIFLTIKKRVSKCTLEKIAPIPTSVPQLATNNLET